MSFRDKLREVHLLRNRIGEYGKLGNDLLQKINYKFRLDWNYYSNRMEGNTLTVDETKSVMVGNINVHNKPLKDVMEMKGHDEVVRSILQIGKGELTISESRIKTLHNAIMYEDSPVEKEKISKWKTNSNQVLNYRGEKFDFTPPSDVADKMHDLINWVNVENEKIQAQKKNVPDPIELAFEFHLRYLTIHPFYDGNGRTGRILMNLILISHGYPPIYIKDAEKDVYYRTLADVQAYGADRFLLFEVMTGYLLRSLSIVSDAIDGKAIEEPGDLDKKLQLLERELSMVNPDNEVQMKYSKDAFFFAFESWISDLLIVTIPIIQKFNKFFSSTNHHISLLRGGLYEYFSNEPALVIKSNFEVGLKRVEEHIGHAFQELRIQTFYGNLSKGGLKSFNCNYSITVKFHEIKYEVFVDDFDEATKNVVGIRKYERLLHQALTDEEMNDIATMLGNAIFRHIDYYTKKNGLRN